MHRENTFVLNVQLTHQLTLQDAVDQVVSNATLLETKLQAYILLCSLLFSAPAPKEMDRLMTTIRNVLKSLGEGIPLDVGPMQTEQLVKSVTVQFDDEPDDSLLDVNHVSSKEHSAIMKAYSILVSLAYVAKPSLYPYFAARWLQYTLQHKGSSEYTPGKKGSVLGYFMMNRLLLKSIYFQLFTRLWQLSYVKT